MERLIGGYIFDQEMVGGKMIFLTGPRQIGKTTFARDWLKSKKAENGYFNWDDPSIMLSYRRNPYFFKNFIDERFIKQPEPLVFDEIHKHKDWRKILKGLFDTNKERMQLLVTGSARLDFFRKSGDSLLGRYFSFRMLPIGLPEVTGDFSSVLKDEKGMTKESLAALHNIASKKRAAHEGLDLLLKFGGFPEPFIKGSERFHTRWQKDYKTLLIKEDARDISRISDIKGLETLVEILPAKVGSRLSIPSLSEDLGRNYDTIKNWVDILEGLYLIFSIQPWHKQITRAIKKEKKIYYFDWSFLTDDGPRFENLLAVSLLKMVARFNETGMGDFKLHYIRDRENREVDFIVVKDNNPVALFEAKKGGREIDRSGRYFSERLKVPLFQITQTADKIEEFPGNCFIVPAPIFLMLTG